MKAIPGFSFFDLGLDNFYPADECGLVEMHDVAKSHFVCWNEGDDGPVMAGKGGHPVFSVIGPKRLVPGGRLVQVSEFEVSETTSGETLVEYGGVAWKLAPGEEDILLTKGTPTWSSEAWMTLSEVASLLAKGAPAW